MALRCAETPFGGIFLSGLGAVLIAAFSVPRNRRWASGSLYWSSGFSFMSNPWDILPTPDKGDPSADITFTAVGRAMTEWEHVESALGDFFAFLLGVDFGLSDPALRAYGSVTSFSNRATMLEQAAEAFFHINPNPQFKERFRRLITIECRKFSARRNEIAHGRVLAGFDKAGGISHFLMPSLYAVKKWDLQNIPQYLYTSKEISHFSREFDSLYHRVAALVNEMHIAP